MANKEAWEFLANEFANHEPRNRDYYTVNGICYAISQLGIARRDFDFIYQMEREFEQKFLNYTLHMHYWPIEDKFTRAMVCRLMAEFPVGDWRKMV